MLSRSLQDWEDNFDRAIRSIDATKRSKAGAFLPIIPPHGEWEDFLTGIKSGWNTWQYDLYRYPACLVILYDGLAFYEYYDGTFWPYFANAVSGIAEAPSANRQTDINAAFLEAAQKFLLRLMPRGKGTDFVGSAVYHIGIPLSLWDGLLVICEWAAWREDWKALSDAEWDDAIQKRAGSRRRLTQFLTGNRESASSFVQEMLDARYVLTRDQSLSITDIAQASILRQEYFDEVPETADFLRPQNPDSLFQDRAKLIWNDQKQKLSVYLPAVVLDRLPAVWQIGQRTQKATSGPDELVLNALAFNKRLMVRLDSGQHSEVQLLRGPEPWGLFDLEAGGRLTNSDRDELPLKSYALLSPEPITIVSLEGFAREENPENEPIELSDGTTCYVTRLWPTGKYAQIILKESLIKYPHGRHPCVISLSL